MQLWAGLLIILRLFLPVFVFKKKKSSNFSCTPVSDSCACVCWYICVTPGTFCHEQLAELAQLAGGCRLANVSLFPKDRRRKSGESVQRLSLFPWQSGLTTAGLFVWQLCELESQFLITGNILRQDLLSSLV